uniref:Secreted protein n=1 Tax=Haemonchus contortus TaxID=6289 RepID=A0A7I5E5X2_HAECO
MAKQFALLLLVLVTVDAFNWPFGWFGGNKDKVDDGSDESGNQSQEEAPEVASVEHGALPPRPPAIRQMNSP